MHSHFRTVKERQDAQRKQEEHCEYILRLANSKKEKRQPKRQGAEVLQSKIILDVTHDYILRPLETYPIRSYNADKQVVGLIRHLFVKYPVPPFMYEVLKKDYQPKYISMHADYILWFLALAQGQSFTKLVKPYMNSKEAYHFLSAPYLEIEKNVWWAKLKTAGIPERISAQVIERIFKNHFFLDNSGRLAELIVFYSHYHQDMGRDDLDAINDFVVWKLANEPNFRFKGRTASSMIKLSNEWHELMQKAKLGKHIEWGGSGIEDWTYSNNNEIWIMQELLNNKELANEGRKQKHCVYGYVSQCMSGSCHIFSLRGMSKGACGVDENGTTLYQPVNELYRITVEVRNRRAVQVRGKLNQTASKHEMDILRIWAGEKGISISTNSEFGW